MEETKYCTNCGEEIPINAKKCRYCYERVEDESISRNHQPQSSYTSNKEEILIQKDNYPTKKSPVANPSIGIVEEYSKAVPIRRLYLLMIMTFGLYSIYWFYKNSTYLKENLGKDISVGLRTFAFLVPIANWIVYYELLKDMKNFIEEKELEYYSPEVNTLIIIFLPFLSLWSLINVQESINEFWKVKEPHLPIRRDFNNTEIIFMALGVLLVAILLISYLILLMYMMTYSYYY